MIATFGGNTQLLNALNSREVEFIIIGGVAVHHYNTSRDFDDLDILINPTLENAQKLITALTDIGLNVTHSAEAIAKPKIQISLKVVQYADIVTPEADINFGTLKENAEYGMVNGVKVSFASKESLKAMKNTDRAKDISDVQLLT